MATLGIVGGLGPESTVDYYRLFLEGYRVRHHGELPALLVYSVSLTRMLRLQEAERHAELVELLLSAVEAVQRAGADLVLIASNTPHRYFDRIAARSPVPLVSIVEAACSRAVAVGLRRPGLLGTGFTMGADFYPEVFARAGLEIVVPSAPEQRYVHEKIFAELEEGRVLPETREGFLRIIGRLKEQEGIDGLILGCTELPLMFPRDELGLPFLNTSRIHVDAALSRLEAVSSAP
ncbi:MAG: amino acid racemase [Spirochaetales bacterium]|nr:amino acid racemase [Spirochaetales bacterium]